VDAKAMAVAVQADVIDLTYTIGWRTCLSQTLLCLAGLLKSLSITEAEKNILKTLPFNILIKVK
jgi:hypothetical protein